MDNSLPRKISSKLALVIAKKRMPKKRTPKKRMPKKHMPKYGQL